MRCEKIQEWLLTDYLDNELDPQRSGEVDGHLKECASCREFFGMVRRTAVTPLKGAEIRQPAPEVWERIRERLVTEKELSIGWLDRLAAVLGPVLRPAQPALRVAFAAIFLAGIVLLTRMPSHDPRPAYAYLEEQMGFLTQLQAGNPDLLNSDMSDYEAVFNEAQK